MAEELVGPQITEHMASQLNKALDVLLVAFEDNDDLLMFSVLEALNSLGSQTITLTAAGMPSIQLASWSGVRWHLAALNELLRRGLKRVRCWNLDSLQGFLSHAGMEVFLFGLQRVGYLADVASVQRAFPTRRAVYDQGTYFDKNDADFVNAVGEFKVVLDRDWLAWFGAKMREHKARLEVVLDRSLNTAYGFSLGELDAVSACLAGLSMSHRKILKEAGVDGLSGSAHIQYVLSLLHSFSCVTDSAKPRPPFTFVIGEGDLSNALEACLGNKKKAQEWIDRLTYDPAEPDLFCSPFLRLVDWNNRVVYCVANWLFEPTPMVMESWVGKFMVEFPRDSAALAHSQLYGTLFEDYVHSRFRDAGVTNIQTRVVTKAADHAELGPFLSKLKQLKGRPKNNPDQFEVDHVIDVGPVGLLVSCKASDFAFDRRYAKGGFFYPFDLLRNTIDRDCTAAKEVEIEVEAVEAIPALKARLGLTGKPVRAAIVTTRPSPCGFPAVQRYLARQGSCPEVAVISCDQVNILTEALRTDPTMRFWKQ